MISQFRAGMVLLPPLSFRLLEVQEIADGNPRLDAFVEATWGDATARFAVECRAISTPKAFQGGLALLKSLSLPEGYRPLLFLPFLSEPQLQELEREGVSGIDLCGNGVVIVPGAFSVYRSGKQNRFSSSAPIKNIYRKNSSMVGRVLLVRPVFDTVQGICSEVNRRNMLVSVWRKKPMSLSTVSKALKTLEEDLVVERKGIIRLQQTDKLMEKLSKSYVPPEIKERVRFKVTEGRGTLRELLQEKSIEMGVPYVSSGMSSAMQYAVMQRGNLLSVYCPRVDTLLERIPGSQSDRFPNLELIETEDETVYFDARQEGDFWWASPVQVYLELMAGDKRDREAAEDVKSYIMKSLQTLQE